MAAAGVAEHTCRFPVEHRADWTDVLFACPTCGRSAAAEIVFLRQLVEALETQVHQLTKK